MSSTDKRFHFDDSFFESPKRYGGVLLHQIGDLCCRSGARIPMHKQICHEISCVVAGTGEFYLNGDVHRVKAGDLFLCPRNSEHAIISSQHNPLWYYYCGFSLDCACTGKEGEALENFYCLPPTSIAPDLSDSVKEIFQLLFNELTVNDSSSAALIHNYLQALLLLTRRCYEAAAATEEAIRKNANFRQLIVRSVTRYIDSNLFSIQRLTDISDALGYSYSYLSQTFSSTMGCSLDAYYQSKRFEKAQELLRHGYTITGVSDALGFDSTQSFSRFFKKMYGAPPSKFKKEFLCD